MKRKHYFSIFVLFNIIVFLFLNLSTFSEDDITEDYIANLKNTVLNSPALGEDLKKTADKLLNDSLTYLQSIDKWNKQIEQLDLEIKNAPEEIKSNEEQAKLIEKTEQIDTSNLSIDEINQHLIQSESEYKQKQEEFEKVYIELNNRGEYRRKLLSRVSELQQQISYLKDSSSTPFQTDPSQLQEVKQLAFSTQIKSLEKELEFNNKELDSFEIKTKIITSRLEKLRFEIREKEREYNFWLNEFNKRRQEEVQKNISNSIALLQSLTRTGSTFTSELSNFTNENLELAKKGQGTDGIENKILSITEKYKYYNQEYKKQKTQLDRLKQNSKQEASLSGWAFSLRQEKSKLPELRELSRQQKELNNELILIEGEYNDLLSRQLKMSDIENQIWDVFNQSTTGFSEYEKKNIKKSIDDLIKTQKNILSSLISDYENYISLLSQTIGILNLWHEHTSEFNQYIDENIIWIRSPFPQLTKIKSDAKQLFTFPSQIKPQLYQNIMFQTILIVSIALLGFAIILFVNKHYEKRIESIASQIKVPLNFSIRKLIQFLYLFFIRIVLLPFWFFVVSLLIRKFLPSVALTDVLSISLRWLCFPLIWGEIIITTIKIPSLSEIIFKHLKHKFKDIFLSLYIFTIWSILCLFFILLSCQLIPESSLADLIFRIVFCLFLLSSAIFLIFLARYIKGKTTETTKEKANQSLNFIRNFLIFISLICIALVVFNLLGYNYGSLEITNKLFFTFFTITILFILFRLSEAILKYYQWKMVLDTSIVSHTTLIRRPSSEKTSNSASSSDETEQQPTQKIFFSQTERVIKYGIVILGFIITIYIWSDIFPALSYLDNIHLWKTSTIIEGTNKTITQQRQTEGSQEQFTQPSTIGEWVSMMDLLKSIIIILITLFLIRNITLYLDYPLSKYTSIQPGERYAIITLSKYIIFTIGILIALGTIKITWSKVQWLIAALGVGFGFGLQEIVANFVSGLILLFERPLRIGDVVTIGDVSGKVKSLRMRSTSIMSWDNKELIVPNKDLLTQRLINWTRNESKIRLCIPIGVSYQSDVNKVTSILTEIARSHPFVENDPEPQTYFLRLGPNAMEFELRVYTNLSYILDLQHGLLCTILERFKQENIEIAYPQLDVHIKNNKTKSSNTEIKNSNKDSQPDTDEKRT